ncbi:flagellar hook-length control protein FliK [Alkalihalobacillus trypoxylicola]|uniref:Flagellar hook-length control protein-like C-terminal domain-containing protein n=1 Tax=Alkalihalobacillus trypoxylicola TaxID=519424 RepID=A0A162F8R0_9BACI|nr:flagellar hook-length control protein FliK [Alkalihalobacillus trypoxylicola]KYG35054.1 hypothetical protein AZF04_01590 [Alkalihalobacillus trypoxylicola]
MIHVLMTGNPKVEQTIKVLNESTEQAKGESPFFELFTSQLHLNKEEEVEQNLQNPKEHALTSWIEEQFPIFLDTKPLNEEILLQIEEIVHGSQLLDPSILEEASLIFDEDLSSLLEEFQRDDEAKALLLFLMVFKDELNVIKTEKAMTDSVSLKNSSPLQLALSLLSLKEEERNNLLTYLQTMMKEKGASEAAAKIQTFFSNLSQWIDPKEDQKANYFLPQMKDLNWKPITSSANLTQAILSQESHSMSGQAPSNPMDEEKVHTPLKVQEHHFAQAMPKAQQASIFLGANQNQEVHSRQMLEQLVQIFQRQVKAGLPNQTQKIQVRLHPEHLGRLDIQVMQQEGVLVAKILTTSHAAKELIESQILQLRQALQQQQLPLEKIEIMEENERLGDEQSQGSQQESQDSKEDQQESLLEEDRDFQEWLATFTIDEQI